MTMTTTIHRLKIVLRTVKPPIWRRIEVASDITLSDLSPLLEATMGWFGGHLHSFQAGKKYYQPVDPDGFFDIMAFGFIDESTVTLQQVAPTEKSKIRWNYDFGDGWEHDITVEAITPADPETVYPICIKGKRACPPEDCGGPWGYEELLLALADPTHERRDELTQWAPPSFDPAHFDLHQTNLDIHTPRPLVGW